MKPFYVVCLVAAINFLILICSVGGTGQLPVSPTYAASTGAGSGSGSAEADTYSRDSRELEPETNFVEFDEATITREQLGHATWTMLHTIAAYFPLEPTLVQIQSAKELLYSIANTFACRICGNHFTQLLKTNPPEFSNRDEFVMHLCEVHNVVNERLGHPQVECDYGVLNEIWGGGECLCSPEDIIEERKFLEEPMEDTQV